MALVAPNYNIKCFPQVVDLVPEAWRTDDLIDALRNVVPDLFECDHKPAVHQIFRALSYFRPDETKIILLGQDPYYQPNKANGLAFGVSPTYTKDPFEGSLGNIRTAVRQQTGLALEDATLEAWAQQGVLLLNRILTVGSTPLSHAGYGWEQVTQQILIQAAAAKPTALLWGRYAQTAATPLRSMGCNIIQCAHPSPLSAPLGFFKCDQFKRTATLVKWGK